MSYVVKHMCGCEIEKMSGLHPAAGYAECVTITPIQLCPQCNEELCDTDCIDLNNVPLYLPNQSDWSRNRRASRGWKEGVPIS